MALEHRADVQMRKDYDKRMEAKRGKRTTWMGTLRYAAGRSPHVKDGSGADVVGDRVIFYIHGMLSTYKGELTGRRRVLLLVSRYAPISDPAPCKESGRAGVCAELSPESTIPLREPI